MTPLDLLVRRMITQDGPLPVSQFMALALQHPEHGYYTKAQAVGQTGDFITAPEISQVFGELIGLWLATVWDQAGRPAPCAIAEAGPGRGVLMADALRAIQRVLPAFTDAADIVLLERNRTLMKAQAAALKEATPQWIDAVDDLPDLPLFFIANEFLDALPVHQWVRTDGGWRERVVAQDASDALVFATGDSPRPEVSAAALPVPESAGAGDIFEFQPHAAAAVQSVATRVTTHGGAALFIDYGGDHDGLRNSFRGIRNHALADPLREVGETDLTVDVNFAHMATAAETAGARATVRVTQEAFLNALGIQARQEALTRNAAPDDQVTINTAIDRLVDPAGMGSIFKVMAIAAPTLGPLPGFPA